MVPDHANFTNAFLSILFNSIEKKYYDDLWEQDRQKKIHREEEDKARQKALNEATMATLDEQLRMLKIQAMEEERLKKEEAELMVGKTLLAYGTVF